MRYEIRFAENHKMPVGKDWMMIQTPTECFVIFREGHVTPIALGQAWTAFRESQAPQQLSA